MKVKSLSRVRLVATPWTAAYQAPPSMGFSRQEYWSGLSLPSPKQGITEFELLAPPPNLRGGEGGWKLSLVTMTSHLINHAYVVKPP